MANNFLLVEQLYLLRTFCDASGYPIFKVSKDLSVIKLSASVLTDQITGANYYLAELASKSGELEKLSGLELLPGMPVVAFLKTNERSPFTYLAKSVTDYFNKAFREK